MILLLGLLIGTVLGLTGAGGSIIAVPLLMVGLGWSLPQAAPVALLAVCVAATAGTIIAWDVAYVRYRAALLMALTGWLTAPLGLKMAAALPVTVLTALFAVVLAAVALRQLLQGRSALDESGLVHVTTADEDRHAQGPPVRLNAHGRIIWNVRTLASVGAVGSGTGFLAGLLGVGGGFVIVPVLRAVSELSMHAVIATSLMTVALTSAGTVVGAVLLGHEIPWLTALPFVLGALAGMLAGRRLAPRIGGPRLQQGFSLVMLLVALGMGAHALKLV